MIKAVIKDTERGEELTLTDLREEYETLKKAGETEAETFEVPHTSFFPAGTTRRKKQRNCSRSAI